MSQSSQKDLVEKTNLDTAQRCKKWKNSKRYTGVVVKYHMAQLKSKGFGNISYQRITQDLCMGEDFG